MACPLVASYSLAVATPRDVPYGFEPQDPFRVLNSRQARLLGQMFTAQGHNVNPRHKLTIFYHDYIPNKKLYPQKAPRRVLTTFI